jgi:hypothetical protein
MYNIRNTNIPIPIDAIIFLEMIIPFAPKI